MKNRIILYTIFLFFIGCNIDTEEVHGNFTLEKNDIKEILIVKRGFLYNRRIFNKVTGEKIKEFNGTWSYKNRVISFESFFKGYFSVKLYDLYKIDSTKYINNNVSLNVDKSLGNLFFEVTEFGKVIARYKKIKS